MSQDNFTRTTRTIGKSQVTVFVDGSVLLLLDPDDASSYIAMPYSARAAAVSGVIYDTYTAAEVPKVRPSEVLDTFQLDVVDAMLDHDRRMKAVVFVKDELDVSLKVALEVVNDLVEARNGN